MYLRLIRALKRSANCEQSLISSGLPIDWRSANVWRQLTANRSLDEGSIFTFSFALIWGPLVVLYSDSPPSAKLFKTFHQYMQCALCRTVKHFTIGWKQKHLGIDRKLVLQLLIAFRNKSAASNNTFICSGSSVLFFSTRWIAASCVFLMLSLSDSSTFGGRWNSTSGIKIWINCLSVFRLHTVRSHGLCLLQEHYHGYATCKSDIVNIVPSLKYWSLSLLKLCLGSFLACRCIIVRSSSLVRLALYICDIIHPTYLMIPNSRILFIDEQDHWFLIMYLVLFGACRFQNCST